MRIMSTARSFMVHWMWRLGWVTVCSGQVRKQTNNNKTYPKRKTREKKGTQRCQRINGRKFDSIYKRSSRVRQMSPGLRTDTCGNLRPTLRFLLQLWWLDLIFNVEFCAFKRALWSGWEQLVAEQDASKNLRNLVSYERSGSSSESRVRLGWK